MNNKPIIQICFTLKTGLTSETILEKMKSLKAKLDNLYGEHCLEEKLGIEVPEETRTGHYVKVPAIYRNTTYSELQA